MTPPPGQGIRTSAARFLPDEIVAATARTITAEQEPRSERFRPSPFSLRNRLARLLWGTVWLFLFRPSPKPFHAWRRGLLRLFGARIASSANIHASARIWAPWNLEMSDHSCLSFGVDCYDVAPVRIGRYATVSQYSFLCTASHDIDDADMALVSAPITVEDHGWVAADVFVGPGVVIGEGAVIGARASVFKSVPPWTVMVGNPARQAGTRSRAVAHRHLHAGVTT